MPGPAAADGPQPWLRAAQGGQTASALAGDERFQPHADQRGLLGDPGQTGGCAKQLVIDSERRFHTYKYGRFMHIRRGPLPTEAPGASVTLGVPPFDLTRTPNFGCGTLPW